MRVGLTAPSSATGSEALAAQISGSISAKSCLVGSCHDQRRLAASSSRADSEVGRTVRTVKRRIAFTSETAPRPRWLGSDYDARPPPKQAFTGTVRLPPAPP